MGGRSEAKKSAGGVGKRREGYGVMKVKKKSVGAVVEPRKTQTRPTAREPEEYAAQGMRAKGRQQQEDEPEDSAGSSSSDDSGSESGGEVGASGTLPCECCRGPHLSPPLATTRRRLATSPLASCSSCGRTAARRRRR